MSQALADGVIKKLRKDAALIASMVGTYPGDTSGDISADAWILFEIAELIDEVDWDTMRAHFLKSDYTEVTYYEDPTSERSTSGVCSDRDHEYG